ncbi:hypothetical protein AAU57_13815 [Nonlabens sp. YIK11]|uniref:four helix bundle protein n=1 Tax=Nonlabens sp. YIK11 TaxID=1453349 RepID=UPI0006DBEC3E|nr:four helix bundle protein [Nonlabens sp. YIK11]KQC34294.1 hypothetical protein AAU57_13815 [Nonlabens sp. YIK11]
MKEKPFELEKRTYNFANDVRKLVRGLKYNLQNQEDGKQLIRSSGSVGANYIESNEHISLKDFQHRIKICRKEAKECGYWLRLLQENNTDDHDLYLDLIDEANQLKLIFNSMIKK